MTENFQLYKCNICGNIVSVFHAGVGQLVCCGQPMQLMSPKTGDVGNEKHVPVIEASSKGVLVKVGSIPHPMEQAHYIEWIELVTKDGAAHIKFLKPGQPPEAVFTVEMKDVMMAMEYCNLHGLWKNK